MTLCVIIDIDNTLADCRHRLNLLPPLRKDGRYVPSGPEWAAFHAAAAGDLPISEIVTVAGAMKTAGYSIVLCTGRGEETRPQTTDWLKANGIGFDQLIMRPYGDDRSDADLKSEMLDSILGSGLLPVLAIEDSESVVRLLCDRGITCLRVHRGASC